MGKMLIVEDTPAKLVLEKSLTAIEFLQGWEKQDRPLLIPLLFLAGSFIALITGGLRIWWVWVIFIIALVVVAGMLYIIQKFPRKIAVTIDLNFKTVTRVETLINGMETKKELTLDQVSRVLIRSEEQSHSSMPAITMWLDSQNCPRLEVMSNNDLLGFVQGTYKVSPEDVSGMNSLYSLGKKIGEFIGKPVIGIRIDLQGHEWML